MCINFGKLALEEIRIIDTIRIDMGKVPEEYKSKYA